LPFNSFSIAFSARFFVLDGHFSQTCFLTNFLDICYNRHAPKHRQFFVAMMKTSTVFLVYLKNIMYICIQKANIPICYKTKQYAKL